MHNALSYVLESLREPPESKLYRFGVWALDQFLFRMERLQEFYIQLMEIPHIRTANVDLYEYLRSIEATVLGGIPGMPMVPPVQGAPGVPIQPVQPAPVQVVQPTPAPPVEIQKVKKVWTKIDADTLIQSYGEDVWEGLDPNVREKLAFLMNSVAMINVGEKAADMLSFLLPEHYEHFAVYLVAKRVSQEQNNQEVYLSLLKKMNLSGFTKAVLKASYHCVNILLESENVLNPGPERNLLKNLGIWLGELTVARNRPPLAKYLNLKKLLLEGYEHGRLSATVPLVCKILLGCGKSKIFKTPNPWLMSLLSILAETYQLELRLNIKFEIEFLFNKLQLEFEDVPVRNHFARISADKRPTESKTKEVIESKAQEEKVEAPSPPISQSPPPQPVPIVEPVLDQPSDISVPARPRGIVIDPSLGALARNPAFKELVEKALDNAAKEIITPVLDRSPHIACITTSQLIVKDFAMEPDERKMRRAAHLMVRNLTANLVIFTGKEPLRVNFAQHLRQLLVAQRVIANPATLEETIQQIIRDNIDFACSMMENFACERAVARIDEQLSAFYAIRHSHREQSHSAFYDMSIFNNGARYPSALPEILRPKPGLTNQQLKVYEDFARAGHHVAVGEEEPLIVAAQAPTPANPAPAALPSANAPFRSVLPEQRAAQEALDYVLTKLDQLVQEISKRDPNLILSDAEVNSTIQNVSAVLFQLQPPHRQELAVEFARTVFTMLLDSSSSIQVDICLMLLKAVRLAYNELAKDLSILLCRVVEEHHFMNADAFLGLIREGLIVVGQFDLSLVKLLSSTQLSMIDFVIAFLTRAVVIERLVPPQEFYNSLETLSKLAQHSGPGVAEQIALFLDRVRPLISRGPADAIANKSVGIVDIHDRRFTSQCYYFFDEWLALFIRHPALPEKLLMQFVTAFEREGMLKNQQTIEEFFRIVLPACIEGCLGRNAAQPSQEIRVEFVDSLAKFVVVLVKLLQSSPMHGVKNLTVLSSFLGLVSEQVLRDYETNKNLMNQKPYYRLFAALIQDLCYPESSLETIEIDILMTLGRTFHNLQPARVPVFCFSWLQLVSHRMFMPAVLLTKNSRCLTFFQTLLVDLFKFLERFLRKPELPDSILLLYRGTLRVLLVLLHDFPEFLCEFHFSFCDVIPPSCIQMRNLILSAFPRNMRLPDPFLPNLKVDLLPEIKQDPKIRSDTNSSLVYSGLNVEVDSYLRNRTAAPLSFFDDLIDRLYLPGKEAAIRGTIFNVPLINSLVLYVGVQGIRNVRQDVSGDSNSAAMDIFQALASKLDEEGRSYFLNAIANQLRYPNNHTHYFSCVLLFLFAEATSETVREQITKVLLERLIVHRPHPWGLLITFIELIKNPKYSLLEHEFTRCAPEIESLFESVARSCMQNSNAAGEYDDRQEVGM
eukprot:TRINITY_DN17089_c0_g3_i1.p1 TRINITY_DN17089_c0_g3~~TRINITY_DN17089_c0_g3_i1.p1  ORF type:complete len:1415 (-),score=395.30 TRINITY_DN17089_c0_g3_i1:74-4294(-)